MERYEQIGSDYRITGRTWSTRVIDVTLHVNHTQGQRSFAVIELMRRDRNHLWFSPRVPISWRRNPTYADFLA